MYNVKKKYRIVKYAERSQMQQLLKNLVKQVYIEVHKSPITDTVKDILWAHPTSIDLLHVFSQVLIMDCTYKSKQVSVTFDRDRWGYKH